MSQYKLIALDMDGTVLNEDSMISEMNKKWIGVAVQQGIHVCFATGRGIHTVRPFIEELQLDSPVVTVNGSEVWKKPELLHKRHTMQPQAITRLRELALHHDTWYWGYGVSGAHRKSDWNVDITTEQWLKFGYYMEDAEIIESIRTEIASWDEFEISNSHPLNIEVNPKGVNKAKGLAEVCQLLGIQMEEVVAMGDSLNDLAMLQAAGFGVAMGNAQEMVKQAADWVGPSHMEGGVAQIIRDKVLHL